MRKKKSSLKRICALIAAVAIAFSAVVAATYAGASNDTYDYAPEGYVQVANEVRADG